MAPFKEERGASAKPTRHTLYSMSQQLSDGGWINHTLIHEVTYVPPEGGLEVPHVGGRDAQGRHGWRPRIQRQVELFDEEPGAYSNAKAAPPPQKEAPCVENDLESAGSRRTSTTDWQLRQSQRQALSTPAPSSSHTRDQPSRSPRTPKLSPSSKTTTARTQSPKRPRRSATSKTRGTDSDES